MFSKIFGQIFDSSIAEDYNCRRMFMDLLVLADRTGAVDMTHEAIARRTNVPLGQVRKYIAELCQPDPTSRSQLEEGKRLVPLDSKRDWGWQIVNYGHYRRLKDEEARRSYFRDAQRRYRAKKAGKKASRKRPRVKYKGLTGVNEVERKLTPSVYVSDSKDIEKGVTKGDRKRKDRPDSEGQVVEYCRQLGLPDKDGQYCFAKWEGNDFTNGGKPIKDWRATVRSWKAAGYLPSLRRPTAAPTERDSRVEREMREAQQELYEQKRKDS